MLQVYTIGGRKLRISVVETTKPQKALQQQDALVAAQRRLTAEQHLDDVLLFVVDILNEEAVFLPASPTGTAIVNASWGMPLRPDGTSVLPGVLSRKKQIIPALEAAADHDVFKGRDSVSVAPDASVRAAP